MRKRLQVACVLALPGELLLFDEPTATVDSRGTTIVWEAVQRRIAAGNTVVVASHDPDAAAVLGAREVRLAGGRVVA